jgi:hypothetical protein
VQTINFADPKQTFDGWHFVVMPGGVHIADNPGQHSGAGWDIR